MLSWEMKIPLFTDLQKYLMIRNRNEQNVDETSNLWKAAERDIGENCTVLKMSLWKADEN